MGTSGGASDYVKLVGPVQRMASFDYQGPANLESACRAIDSDMATCVVSDYKDRVAYPPSEFTEETKALNELVDLIRAGRTYISFLYTYRSVSRTLVNSLPNTADDDLIRETHRKVFSILNFEVQKLHKFMVYQHKAILTMAAHFQALVRAELKKLPLSQEFLDKFLECLNVLVVLDTLKNNKSSLTNDFAFYRRSFARIRANMPDADAIAQRNEELQMFLNNPARPRDYIIASLREYVQKVEQYDMGLCALLEHVQETLEQRRFLLNDEEFALVRVIPFLLFLVDSDVRDSNSSDSKREVNVFKHKRLQLSYFQKLFKVTPVVPLYGDMHLTVTFVLRQCPHWDEDDMIRDWTTARPEKLAANYLLVNHHAAIREQYNSFASDFAAMLNEVKAFQATQKQITPKMLERVFVAILHGLRTVSQWNARIRNQCAWKYANPCPRDQYMQLSGKAAAAAAATASSGGSSSSSSSSSSSTTSSSAAAAGGAPPATERKTTSGPMGAGKSNGEEYEQAVRYNYTPQELHVLIDVLGMIKGIGSVMLENELIVTPLVNRCIHDDVQIFLQSEVARPLRKAYKNNRKDVFDVLNHIREIGGDWFDYSKQKEDYLQVKKVLLQVNRDFPRRPTAPSPTQLSLVRRMMHTVFSPKAPGMKGGLFTEKNLKDDWLPVWRKFYEDSFFYSYLLDYGNTIKSVTDMSFLWFREFYLEITGCVQFPIGMSLPWVMTDYLIKTPAMKDNIFFPFDIYNDAAASSLHSLKQQHLYDEVEAETNLSFVQLMYHLSLDIFAYYKAVAGGVLLDKDLKARYIEARAKVLADGSTNSNVVAAAMATAQKLLTVQHARYRSLVAQTHVTLLGRNVDVAVLVASHCNAHIKDNLVTVIRKFESADLSSVLELRALIQNVRLTHELLSSILTLDRFDHIFKEANDSVGLGGTRSRILMHVLQELATDILPNFVFCSETQRFVRSMHPVTTSIPHRDPAPSAKGATWYGKGFKDPFDKVAALGRGFIGHEHWEAIMDLLSEAELMNLVKQVS